MMEKNIEISILSQIYKNTLTEKQFEILDEYYNNDFSLSEIAENYNITISSNEIRKILLNSRGDEKKKTLEDSELLLKMIY